MISRSCSIFLHYSFSIIYIRSLSKWVTTWYIVDATSTLHPLHIWIIYTLDTSIYSHMQKEPSFLLPWPWPIFHDLDPNPRPWPHIPRPWLYFHLWLFCSSSSLILARSFLADSPRILLKVLCNSFWESEDDEEVGTVLVLAGLVGLSFFFGKTSAGSSVCVWKISPDEWLRLNFLWKYPW